MVVEGCGGAHLTHQTVAVTKKQRGLVSRIAISVKLEKASVRSPFTTGLQHVCGSCCTRGLVALIPTSQLSRT